MVGVCLLEGKVWMIFLSVRSRKWLKSERKDSRGGSQAEARVTLVCFGCCLTCFCFSSLHIFLLGKAGKTVCVKYTSGLCASAKRFQMGSITIGTLSPAFCFVALILVTNCRKTYIKPRVCSECFFIFFFLFEHFLGYPSMQQEVGT